MTEKWDPKKGEWVEEYPKPPEMEKRKPHGAWFILGAVLLVTALAGVVIRAGAGGEETSRPENDVTLITPAPVIPNPLEPSQLKGLALSALTRALEGDYEIGAAMIEHAESLTHCDILIGDPAFDLADKFVRRSLRKQGEAQGYTVAFAHKDGKWLALAQNC